MKPPIPLLLLLAVLAVFSTGCIQPPAAATENETGFNLSPLPAANISEQNPGISRNFSGTRDSLVAAGYLDHIIAVFAEVSGNGPFILTLENETGKQKIVFAEPGPFGTRQPEYFSTSFAVTPGNYMLNILADDAWNVSLVSGERAHSATNENHRLHLTGFGSQNILLPPFSDGLTVFKGYSREKITVDLVVNGVTVRHLQTDPSGLIGLQAVYPLTSPDTVSLNIVSDGEWILEVTQPLPASPFRFERVSGTGNYVSSFFVFGDKENQELAFSNRGSMPVTVLLYVPNSTVPVSMVIPAHTEAYHYRMFQIGKPIVSVTALLEIIAENTDSWSVEQCDYRVYFKRVSPESISQETVSPIQENDLLAYPVLQRFADTRFTAAYIPASESEIQKLMKTNSTIVAFSGTYYSFSVSD